MGEESMKAHSEQSQKQTLVIIGAGMAGSKLAHAIVTEQGERYQVVLIGEEAKMGYNRIMLSSLLAKEISESDMSLVDMPALTQSGACLIASDPVVSLTLEAKSLSLQSGLKIAYDKLVFATGARASRLPIEGINASNVTQFRDWADVDLMSEIPEKSEVCVIGAGLLGLEAAVGMAKRGHRVSVVHRSDNILNRQLDKKSARLLQNNLEKMGICFHLGSAPVALMSSVLQQNEDKNLVDTVKLASGKLINTQLVVLATGIKPEVALAKSAGLAVNKAIKVNAFMETSAQDVFALGECTEFEQTTFGLVAPIWQQFDVLVDRLTHKSSKFCIEPVATKLKVSGINLFSAGEIDADQQSKSITYLDSAQNNYRKLVIKDGVLVGAILYGNVADGSWYFQLIQNKTKVSKVLDQLVFGEAYCHGYDIQNNAFIENTLSKLA